MPAVFWLEPTFQVSTFLMKLAYGLSISRDMLYYKALFYVLEIREKSCVVQ